MVNNHNNNGTITRHGEEAELQRNLADSDIQSGRKKSIRADISSSNREEQRRGKFVDLHADEDGDPNTSERDVYGDKNKPPARVAAKGRGKLMRTLKKMVRK